MKDLNTCFVYIVRCSDDSLYTGWTTNMAHRLMEHNTGGKGAKYTRGRRPVILVYQQQFSNRSPALKEERRIKKLSRKEKETLIKNYSWNQNIKKKLYETTKTGNTR